MNCCTMFKLVQLCQLPIGHFEARVPSGDIQSFSVCRHFVANYLGLFQA